MDFNLIFDCTGAIGGVRRIVVSGGSEERRSGSLRSFVVRLAFVFSLQFT